MKYIIKKCLRSETSHSCRPKLVCLHIFSLLGSSNNHSDGNNSLPRYTNDKYVDRREMTAKKYWFNRGWINPLRKKHWQHVNLSDSVRRGVRTRFHPWLLAGVRCNGAYPTQRVHQEKSWSPQQNNERFDVFPPEYSSSRETGHQ